MVDSSVRFAPLLRKQICDGCVFKVSRIPVFFIKRPTMWVGGNIGFVIHSKKRDKGPRPSRRRPRAVGAFVALDEFFGVTLKNPELSRAELEIQNVAGCPGELLHHSKQRRIQVSTEGVELPSATHTHAGAPLRLLPDYLNQTRPYSSSSSTTSPTPITHKFRNEQRSFLRRPLDSKKR